MNKDTELLWEAYKTVCLSTYNYNVILEGGWLKGLKNAAIGAASLASMAGSGMASDVKQYGIDMQNVSHAGSSQVVQDKIKGKRENNSSAIHVNSFETHINQSIDAQNKSGTDSAIINNLVVEYIKTVRQDNGLETIVFSIYGDVAASSQEEANQIALKMVQKSLQQKPTENPVQIKVRLENRAGSYVVKLVVEVTKQ